MCSTRNEMEEDLNKSLRASFWTRSFVINPLYIIGGLVVVAVYIILPVYLYSSKLRNVCCNPDKGTELSCNATDAAAGDGTASGVPPTLRKLLAPVVDAVEAASQHLGAHLADGVIQQQLGASSEGGSRPDPWSLYVVRG